MTDIMLDLETMGTGPDAAVVAIGACAFDLERGILATFQQAVDLESSLRTGGRVDGTTVMWWLAQSDEARAALARDAQPVDIAVALFCDWFRTWTGGSPRSQVWGDGSDFDNVIMQELLKRLRLPPLWTYKQNRDYRTVKHLRLDIPLPVVGIEHVACDDAVAQALHLMQILRQGVPPGKPVVTVDEIMEQRADQAS